MIKGTDLFFGEILSNNKIIFRINDYQRHYVWKKSQIIDFLKDIERIALRRRSTPDLVHFFGQFIYHKVGDPDRRGRIEYEIIDGQQRITTFLIYIASIRGISFHHTTSVSTAPSLMKQCDNCLYSMGMGMMQKNKLSLSNIDNDYFQALINAKCNYLPVSSPIEDCPESHKNLYEAQSTIQKYIDQTLVSYEPAEIITYLQEQLNTAVNSFQIVGINTENAEYTYQLYQVVNDRGEPLHEGELLKAKTAEVLDGNYQFSHAIAIWDDILKDSGKITDEYLKWSYMSLLGASPSSDRFYNEFLLNYFELSPDTVIDDVFRSTYLAKLEGLHSDIKLCRKLVEGVWPFPEDPNAIVKSWQKEILTNLIVKAKHTLCIPVLLSAYHQAAYRGVSTEVNFAKCLELCENCFILIRLVCTWREDKFKDKYLTACVKMRDSTQNYYYQNLQAELCNISLQDIQRVCSTNLQTMAYKPKGSNMQIKYLLILLERYWNCFENNKLYPDRIHDGFTLVNNELSIEHIYSESKSVEEMEPHLEKVKHTLGNLLIYGRKANTELKDLAYGLKKDKYLAAPYSTANHIASTYETWSFQSYQEYHEKTCSRLVAILLRFYPTN